MGVYNHSGVNTGRKHTKAKSTSYHMAELNCYPYFYHMATMHSRVIVQGLCIHEGTYLRECRICKLMMRLIAGREIFEDEELTRRYYLIYKHNFNAFRINLEKAFDHLRYSIRYNLSSSPLDRMLEWDDPYVPQFSFDNTDNTN